MSKKHTHQEFLNILLKNNDCYKSKMFEVIEEYKGANNKILLKDKYGIVNVQASTLMNGICYQINSAINKTSYYINKAIEVHGDKYDYSLVEYKKSDSKIRIRCKKHNLIFEQSPASHLRGTGCYHCGIDTVKNNKTFTIETYTEKARNVHGYKYTYEDFKNTSTLMTLNCDIHGEFEINPTYHLQGTKCPACTIAERIKKNQDNPTGWRLSRWVNFASKSKEFDSFKVYLIRCWDKEEEFYKIGRTYKKIIKRFYGQQMPYNYEIIKILVFEEGRNAFYKELEMKKFFKKKRYLPNIKFNGRYECFNKDINIEKFKY